MREQALAETMLPVGLCVLAEAAGAVEEAEFVVIVGGGALEGVKAIQEILVADVLVELGAQGVLMGFADDRDLVVENRPADQIGLRKVLQKRGGLRAEEARRNDVAGSGAPPK